MARASPRSSFTAPSAATSRDGRPRASNQSGAPGPRMTAAVLAVLASTQLAAATLTVRQSPVAGRPVAGSTRW